MFVSVNLNLSVHLNIMFSDKIVLSMQLGDVRCRINSVDSFYFFTNFNTIFRTAAVCQLLS